MVSTGLDGLETRKKPVQPSTRDQSARLSAYGNPVTNTGVNLVVVVPSPSWP
jgi:hypothetical protein